MNDLFQNPDQGEPRIDESKDYLAELVGPGKKFKDMQELAKGKYYADEMVKIQNERMDTLRQDYLKLREQSLANSKLEEMLKNIASKPAESTPPPAKAEIQPQFDPKELDDMIDKKVTAREAARRANDNESSVRNKLKQEWGDQYARILKQKTEELGLRESYVQDLARESPTALYRTLGLDQPQMSNLFQSPPTSQRRDSFAPTAAPERTWAYYQDLKAKDPKAWLDKKTSVQMQEDAIRMGDKFYDGDFYKTGLHEK